MCHPTLTSVSTLLVKCCMDKCLLPGKNLCLLLRMLNWWIISIYIYREREINIYLHRECFKTSFICCFIMTTENLIWPVVLTGRGIIFTCSYAEMISWFLLLTTDCSFNFFFYRNSLLLNKIFNILNSHCQVN